MISSTGEHAKVYRDAPRYGGFHDPSGMLHFRDLPCPMVNVNYPMELVCTRGMDPRLSVVYNSVVSFCIYATDTVTIFGSLSVPRAGCTIRWTAPTLLTLP